MGLPAGLSSCPKANATQKRLQRNVTAFISAEDWPPVSPDLNSWYYKLWASWRTWLAKSVTKTCTV